ncbi:unnamed protein product [Hermetia illucens]|uniref:Glucose-methanol-choline oxidoreductase N-terminal domain-containing protein n=1 Tax=Hermetia illucens TaxID=343691 RepID=A0A7R8UTA7_HERIL|nr:glucose dehydrogenase [FAD, quinone]-like [Hermetia illucens]CAD7086669.1 unnamed protein product [Hermetia illucens]
MEYFSSECLARSAGPGNQLISTLIASLVTMHCNMSHPSMWPKDYGPTALEIGLEPYDFIVIGGGTSGSVVASRLSENPEFKVLLLEAGGDPPIESEIPGLTYKVFHTEGDWQYKTTSNQLSCMAMQDESCVWNRGKTLGGTSSMDSMLYSRGVSRDYDYWEHRGNSMWSWRDILPYFRKLENFRGPNQFNTLGTKGPVNIEAFWSPKDDQNMILEAANELGYKLVNDFLHDDYSPCYGWHYGMGKDGWRMSSAKAYLSGEKGNRPNLHVIKYAVAKEIGFTKNKKAEKVSFVYNGEHNLEAKAKREIIVSAGPIETPKLLMLSGIGPSTILKNQGITVIKDLQVGDNLQDHARVDLFCKFSQRFTQPAEIRKLDAIFNQVVHRFGSYGAPTLDVGGFINTKNSSRYPDIQFAFIPVANISDYARHYKETTLRGLVREVRDTDKVIVCSVILLRPKSRGHVRLQSSDYREQPLIIPNTFQKDVDVETMIQGIKQILRLEETETFHQFHAKFIKVRIPACNNERYRTVRYWECYVKHMSNTFYQPAGTAKMGPSSDPNSVVDAEMRVRGVRGLRVVDASIMPTMVSGPITGPTIMIGEKGADSIIEGWKDFQ